MPKNKTHSGISKRVKVSGSGKLLREKTGKRHLLEKKPSTLTRRYAGIQEVGCVGRSVWCGPHTSTDEWGLLSYLAQDSK